MLKTFFTAIGSIALAGACIAATFPSVTWGCGSGRHEIYKNHGSSPVTVRVELTSCSTNDCSLTATGAEADVVPMGRTAQFEFAIQPNGAITVDCGSVGGGPAATCMTTISIL